MYGAYGYAGFINFFRHAVNAGGFAYLVEVKRHQMVLNAKVFNWSVCLNRLFKALTAVYGFRTNLSFYKKRRGSGIFCQIGNGIA